MTKNINQYRQWIDQLLDEGRTVQVPVYGMSMFPILMPRDTVQIKRITFEEMKPGQVLVFEQNGQWVAHRLVKKITKNQTLITRGDGLPYSDAPVDANRAKGIITKVIKTRSPFARSINTKIDQFLVGVAPVTGWFFWTAGRIVSWGLQIR
ncbi:S24 family peptidase [Marinilabilia salmonicolor]|uniref:S24 family peptidase n=1 Tax=Marinilabilia salmonicolor TaxID=989 RepID=UPI000299DA87|nr:S24 family peptidase [Marinilabilia salmonicolor]